MDNNIKEFIQECKQEQEWKERWNKNHIEFDNYFKDSGEVEESVTINELPRITFKSPEIDCEVISFWFENPDYTFEEIAHVFDCSYGSVKSKLDKYFNSKEIYNA